MLGKLHTLKPNRIEAELLSGVPITDDASLPPAADALLATGLHRVFISLGADGVFAADQPGQAPCRSPVSRRRMVNTTGCGDAFMAALGLGLSARALGLDEAARGGPGRLRYRHGGRRDHQSRT